jgi:hypothetical protein
MYLMLQMHNLGIVEVMYVRFGSNVWARSDYLDLGAEDLVDIGL